MAKLKICIDAGHYGKYNRSPVNKAYYESEAMWRLHLLQKKYLEEYGFEVITTRPNQAVDKSLSDRGKISEGCVLCMSDHSNAEATGIVDYPVVYVPLNGKGDELGRLLAQCIQETMGTREAGRIATREGKNGDYYGVIRAAVGVGTVGMILEHSFHTNTKATNWLLNESNLDKLARAEAKVIAEYFGMTKPAAKPVTQKPAAAQPASGTTYRVQAGSFANKANADAQLKKIKAKGFDACMVTSGGMYKIQAGAFSNKANAEAMVTKLKKAGFDACITTKGGQTVAQTSPYYPKYTGNSKGVDTVLRTIGVPEGYLGSWKKRKAIATKNGIANYTGTIEQNTKLISLAKKGVLLKV